jgi:hypothetical protein
METPSQQQQEEGRPHLNASRFGQKVMVRYKEGGGKDSIQVQIQNTHTAGRGDNTAGENPAMPSEVTLRYTPGL